MFGKSRRFRAEGPSQTDAAETPSPGIIREATITGFREDEAGSTQQGAPPDKNLPTGDNEAFGGAKRSTSTERKISSTDKKKANQRELKRSTSYIPRAASQRARTPISREEKKPGRKSDTSLKSKEVSEDAAAKEKKSEGGKGNVKLGAAVREPSTVRHKTASSRNVAESPGRTERVHRAMASPSVEQEGQPAPSKSVEAQYAAKKTVYGLMIREFEEKKKAVRDQYRLLQELRKRVEATTGKELPPEETVQISEVQLPFVIGQDVIKGHIMALDKREVITFETKLFGDLEVDFTDFEISLESSINQYQDMWLHLLPAIMDEAQEMVGRLSEISPELREEFEKEEKSIELAIENAKYMSRLKGSEIMAEVKRLYTNREILKQELKAVLDSDKFSNSIAKEVKELAARLREVEEELAKEKVRNEDLLEKRNLLQETNIAESEKIRDLEQTIAAQQTQLAELEYQCKTLKQKELAANRGIAGLKPKDIKDLKAKSDLLKALEIHITELTNDYNEQKKTFQSRIAQLEEALTETEEALKSETQAKNSLETSLAEAEETIRSVREKKKVFCEMVDKTKQIIQTGTNGPSKREEQLWTELEATRIVVKGYQDQLNKLTDEKNKILLKFQTISEDKSNQNAERLAADLVRKEEIIKTLKDQVTQLQGTCEEHTMKYNKLLAQVKEVHERMDGKSDVATLSKQLSEIKTQKRELQEVVKELVSHNKELETALIQRSLELDQRDRLVKQQCNLLKMRDELTDLVRSKDDVQGRGAKKVAEPGPQWEKRAEKIYKDLEKKANESDDIYKVLVEKQKQVEKLTKLVKIMEDQQDRAQEQRVRFESKIAELQRQLIEGGPKAARASLFGN